MGVKRWSKLAKAISAAGIEPRELSKLLDEVASSQAARWELIEAVEHAYASKVRRTPQARDPNDDMVRYVREALIVEAKLSPEAALQQLARHFASANFAVPSPKPREDLARWLRRVAKVVPPSDILHFATRIAREASGQKQLPWRLGRFGGENNGDPERPS